MASYKYYIYAIILIAGIFLGLILNRFEDSSVDTSSPEIESKTGPQQKKNNNTRELAIGSLIMQVPVEWKEEKPTSSLRIGQFRLSGLGIKEDDAELTIFSGIGGSTENNLSRWYSQFQQPDGLTSNEKAITNTFSIQGMQVIVTDLSGTYLGSGMPMSSQLNLPDYRLLAAIVETSDDHYYFKLVGPQATVNRWASSFDEFILSVRVLGQ